MRERLAILALLACGPAFGADGPDPDGRYGFDWSEPETAKCVLVDAALKRRLGRCARADTPSFTGASDHLVCPIGKGEFLAFPTRERCVEELETMQANAP